MSAVLARCRHGRRRQRDRFVRRRAADERGTSLTITVPQEPASWNYWKVAANALRVPTFYNVQETLLENLPDGTIIPMLAEAYEVSDDGLTVTFHIREAKFHDGTDLDSADVVYSMNKNAESPTSKLSAVYDNVASIKAPDDRTVVVTLKNPSASFIEEMGMSAGYIVPEDFFENYDPETQMIGTGPYVFGEYKPDTSLTMTRFDDYWGDKPYFTDLTWLFVTDETAALNGLEAGDYDIVAAVVGEGMDRVHSFEENPDFQVAFDSSEVSYTFLNVNKPELQDIRVRQAIAHAFDRQPYIDAAIAGYGVPTCLMAVPNSVPYNSDYCPYPYDPEKARDAARRGRRVGPPPRLPVRHGGVPPGGDGDHDRPVRRRRHHPRHPGRGPDDVARPDVDAGRLRDQPDHRLGADLRSTAARGAVSPSARARSSASPSSRTCSPPPISTPIATSTSRRWRS